LSSRIPRGSASSRARPSEFFFPLTSRHETFSQSPSAPLRCGLPRALRNFACERPFSKCDDQPPKPPPPPLLPTNAAPPPLGPSPGPGFQLKCHSVRHSICLFLALPPVVIVLDSSRHFKWNLPGWTLSRTHPPPTRRYFLCPIGSPTFQQNPFFAGPLSASPFQV